MTAYNETGLDQPGWRESEDFVADVKEQFQSVYDLWMQALQGPEAALATLPRAFRALAVVDGLDPNRPHLIEPADLYCRLQEVTEDLVDPNKACLERLTLPYDPWATFGPEAVAALVAAGYQIYMKQSSAQAG